MKLIITGALGHIGSSFIREVSKDFQNLEIIMIDNLSTQRYSSLFDLPQGPKYRFIEGDLQECDLGSFIQGANCVLHLAAMTDAAGTADQPDLVHKHNFEITKRVADACLESQTPLIFPSSTSVYGSQEETVDEECEDLKPQSPYAECKLKEEAYLKVLSHQGLQMVICRLGTIYGTSPGIRFHTAVNKFCWQGVMGQALTVWETALDQKRPYLFLKDAVRAFSWVIEKRLFDGRTYNIVSGNHTVRDVTDFIGEKIPNLKISLVSHKIMNQLSYEVLSLKFKATGFSFEGSLKDGIFETIDLLQHANLRAG